MTFHILSTLTKCFYPSLGWREPPSFKIWQMHNTNIFATWAAQWKYRRTIDKKQNIQIPINECQNNGLSRTLKCFNCSHLCAHLIKCLSIMSNIPCLVRLNMEKRSCKETHLAQPFFNHAAGATGKTGPFSFHVLAKPSRGRSCKEARRRLELWAKKYLSAVAISCVSFIFKFLRWLYMGWENASQINVITVAIVLQHPCVSKRHCNFLCIPLQSRFAIVIAAGKLVPLGFVCFVPYWSR